MGFGSIATAIHAYGMITEAILNESHGILNPGKSDMQYFRQRLKDHEYVTAPLSKTGNLLIWPSRKNKSTEYKTMKRAAEALFRRFPGIKREAERGETQRFIPKLQNVRYHVLLLFNICVTSSAQHTCTSIYMATHIATLIVCMTICTQRCTWFRLFQRHTD